MLIILKDDWLGLVTEWDWALCGAVPGRKTGLQAAQSKGTCFQGLSSNLWMPFVLQPLLSGASRAAIDTSVHLCTHVLSWCGKLEKPGFSAISFMEKGLMIRINNCSENSFSPVVLTIKHMDGVSLHGKWCQCGQVAVLLLAPPSWLQFSLPPFLSAAGAVYTLTSQCLLGGDDSCGRSVFFPSLDSWQISFICLLPRAPCCLLSPNWLRSFDFSQILSTAVIFCVWHSLMLCAFWCRCCLIS